jgi:hypothetical protein
MNQLKKVEDPKKFILMILIRFKWEGTFLSRKDGLVRVRFRVPDSKPGTAGRKEGN